MTNPGSILARELRLGGAISGYILLAGSSVFLVNLVYQAFKYRVFDGVIAAMIGVIAAYCMIAILLIAACSRAKGETIGHLRTETSPPHGSDPSPDRPDLRLLRFDAFDSARDGKPTPKARGRVSRAA